MFALDPDGKDSGSSSSGSASKKYVHFFKLSLYFVAIRAAHIYFGPSSETNTESG